MEVNFFVEFLNSFFAPFDEALFTFCQALHNGAGVFLDPLFKFITIFGDKGIFFIVFGVLLTAFPKTRRFGVAVLFALLIGSLITNVALKNLVARPRPYIMNDIARALWTSVGQGPESDLSFPSGHTTAAFAFATAIFLTGNKKYSWTVYFAAFAIAFSRIYLAVHYPTDVIAGLIVGVAAGFAAYYPAKYVSSLLVRKKGDIPSSADQNAAE